MSESISLRENMSLYAFIFEFFSDPLAMIFLVGRKFRPRAWRPSGPRAQDFLDTGRVNLDARHFCRLQHLAAGDIDLLFVEGAQETGHRPPVAPSVLQPFLLRVDVGVDRAHVALRSEYFSNSAAAIGALFVDHHSAES